MNKYKYILTLLLFVSGSFVWLLYQGLSINMSELPSSVVGKQAFSFEAKWLQGSEYVHGASPPTLNSELLKGKTIVLNFWASWCVSCRQEAKELEAYWQRVKKRGDVYVIGIAIQDTDSAALSFAKSFGKTYPLLRDTTGSIGVDYGVTGVPETFIINEAGVVVKKYTGPVSTAELIKLVNKG